MVNVDRVEQALREIEEGELGKAAALLGPLVRGKRLVRASRSNAAAEEVDEVKFWLKRLIEEPDAEDAESFLARAYYKLRSQMPSE
jgi:hypothetical protein